MKCKTCKGRRFILNFHFAGIEFIKKCPDCKGSGYVTIKQALKRFLKGLVA